MLRNSKGYYKLSPAYDLLPTRLLLSEKQDSEELALHLNGKKSNFNRSFLGYGEYLGISEKVSKNNFKTRTSSTEYDAID